MSTSQLASRSDSAPSKLPQGSLEPRASSPSGDLTRTRQIWGAIGELENCHTGGISWLSGLRSPIS
ncbi:hypothetical protein THI_2646 [Thiomonas arsenitoxydans]|uniref:Uncharacterized protein n=1 Tax=Thiomonas arsenitoxydans (strain DSM 22701 / CIP 110005 / 3As) TaxID=426114 RepID=D6CVE3_THIA3|nr:hypothetical protein THI_2646 [Thiomonas arsenitoxydans]